MPANETSSRTPEQWRDLIQSWLQEEGWSIGIPAAPTPDMRWVLTGQDPGGRHVLIAQRIDRSDQILINGGVTVSDEHRQRMAALGQDERDAFIWELHFTLLGTDVEFQLIGDPLERVMIAQRIYYDALTKDAFLQRVSDVRKGVILVIGMVRHQFRETPPRRELGFKTQ
ncbi:MAG: DUF2299 family protein [Chloroflexi bacterium]|nr:DUF2299 family protein [Chloroflexota bacterium]